MRRSLAGKLREVSGQSLLELALLLPVLVALTLGLIDLSRAIHAHNSIVNMSREGANLASRSTLIQQPQGRQMIMNSLAGTAQSLDMKGNGMMYLTEVQGTGGMPFIASQTPWSQRPDPPPSAVSAGSLAKTLGKIQVGERDSVWIFEVFYNYQSMFAPARGFHPQLHTVAIFAGGLR